MTSESTFQSPVRRRRTADGLLVMAMLLSSVWGCRGKRSQGPVELIVTATSPQEVSHDPGAVIQVQFDRPVVGEDAVGKPITETVVSLEPEAAVGVHWFDRQTLVVTPTGALKPSTRYRVKLRGTLGDRAGGFEFAFVQQPLDIEGVPGVDLERLPATPSLNLRFNQPVAGKDVVEHCSIRGEDGKGKFALSAEEPARVDADVTVTSAKALAQGKGYELVCKELAGAGGNIGLAEPYVLGFRTYSKVGLTRMRPQGDAIPADDVEFELNFATPVDIGEIRAHLSSEPVVPGLDKGWMNNAGTRYRVNLNLETTTDHLVRISKGLTDTYGQVLEQEVSYGFTTADARPQISIETGIYAVEPSSGGYPVWSRNVPKYEVDCARVPKNKVTDTLAAEIDFGGWRDDDDELDWKQLGLAHRESSVTVKDAKNKWHLDRLALHEQCGGSGERGLFLVQLSSDAIEPDGSDDWSYRPYRRVLANVTDLGVLVKVGSGSGLIWVTSVAEGKPVAGARVTVFTPEGKVTHTATSDRSGIARLPARAKLLPKAPVSARDDDEEEFEEEFESSYRSRHLVVVVEKAGDMAVIDGNWDDGLQTWNFDVRSDYSTAAKRIRGFIQSDRGMYRPGETVHFKGLIREVALGRKPAVPRRGKVDVKVENSRGSILFDEALALTRFGGFSFDLEVDPEASLGDYYVKATFAEQTFRESFSVEEFRKVGFEVALTAGDERARIGERMLFDVGANHLFGAPVVGARVRWSLERRRHYLSLPGYGSYDFSDTTRSDHWYHGAERDESNWFSSDGKGMTDKRGRYAIKVRDPSKNIRHSQDYSLEVRVTDKTGQTITKSTAMTAHLSDFYIGLDRGDWVQKVADGIAVATVAVAPDGKRVATAAKLSLVRESWECKYSGGYRSYSSCELKHEKVSTKDISVAASGKVREHIAVDKPGEYIVRIEAKDSHGIEVSASSYVWMTGSGKSRWQTDESNRVALITSKKAYAPGDVARLVPRTNLENATALVTLERNGIIEAFVKPMASTSEGIDIALDDTHAPNVYASVAMVTGRSGPEDRQRPRFKLGVVDLEVSAKEQRLDVAISTAKPTYEPGEKVTAVIKVSAAGKPVSAEVSLSVADEGVLQLIAYQTPNPMATFYAKWGLGVDNATNWTRIARLDDPSAADYEDGMDVGGGGPKIRSRFVSSAYWAPALVTNARGEISVTFTAPDNLTAFRIMAVAADSGARFGSGEERITIRKPLLAKPIVPRFMTAGDRGELGVVVHNYTGQAGTATVVGKAEGAWFGETTKSVDIDDKGSARVRFTTTAGERASASFEFTVTLGKHSDGLRVTVPVNRPFLTDHKTLARGELGGKGGDKRAEIALTWGDDVVKRDSMVTITVDRGGMAELEPSLRYLIEYPHGCLEQTLSKFIPMTQVKELAGSLGLAALDGPELARFIRAGAAKVARHQDRDNGHFRLWPGSESEPHLTVAAIYGLNEAKRAKVRVDEQVMERGVDAMRSWARSSTRKLGPDHETSTVAMAAYLLADLGKADSGLNARLYAARAGMPIYGQALLLRALHLSKAPAEQIATLKKELLGYVVVSGASAKVEENKHDDRYFSSNTRSTAITLSALLEVDPDNALVGKLVEGLVSAQGPGGRWENTQDNLYALVALAAYARRQRGGAAKVTVSHNGKQLTKQHLKGNSMVVMRHAANTMAGKLTIEAKGGVARYSVRVAEVRKDSNPEPVERGIKVTREYLCPVTGRPLTRFSANQLVTVRLTVDSAAGHHYIVVSDPLPAGFEAVNTRLATEAAADDEDEYYDDYDYYEEDEWVHRELRDDGFVAFADWLESGEHTLEYQARVTLPGKFTVLPAHAEAMYKPTINGRTGALEVTIKR